nr:protein AE7-like 1 [Cryptomonas sp.]
MFDKIKAKKKFDGTIEWKTWMPLSLIIYLCLKEIKDPEYPYYLYNLNVLHIEGNVIEISNTDQILFISIFIIPTYNLCSMTSVIGLSVENTLLHSSVFKILFSFFPIDWGWNFCINIPSDMHVSGLNVTKQLNDRERISAAIENSSIRNVIKSSYSKKNIKFL